MTRPRTVTRQPDAVEASDAYLGSARMAQVAEGYCFDVHCGECRAAYLRTDAASISLDLAVAQESEERTRKSVAWA